MTQGAAEQFSDVLNCGVCEGRDVSGQSMVDPDRINWCVRVEQTKKCGCCCMQEVTLAPGAQHW